MTREEIKTEILTQEFKITHKPRTQQTKGHRNTDRDRQTDRKALTSSFFTPHLGLKDQRLVNIAS